jgi:phage terminase Nu1 subunit (DNA packaging protein)
MRIEGQENIARVFGVAPKTIVEWQEAGFPVAERGGPGVPSVYETESCINWLVTREVKKVQAELPRDRLARVQAESIEMDNAVKRGQLIPAAELEPKLRATMVSARELLRNARSAIARQVQGKNTTEIEALVQEVHDQFLTRLSRWSDAQVDDEEGDGA